MRFSILSLRAVSILSLLSVTTAVVAGCSSAEEAANDEESAVVASDAQLPDGYKMAWNEGRSLPEAEKWTAMYTNAEKVAESFNSGGSAFSFGAKGSGGSSVYAKVKDEAAADKPTIGIWSPPNAATYVPEEIFAFTLSRLFGHGDWAAPATRVTLNKVASDNYEAVVKSAKNTGARGCNLEHQLKYRGLNPNYFIGVYKEFVPFSVSTVGTLAKDNALNGTHSVAKFLARGGRKATDAPVYLVPAQTAAGSTNDILVAGDPGYDKAAEKAVARSTEKEVAAQLNHMLVVDVLNGQRDRYGNGTNMGVYIDKTKGTFALALIDNGGGNTAISSKYVNDFKSKVTRFDPTLAKDVIELDEFVNGAATTYKGFTDKEALKRALGYEDVDNVNVGSYNVTCPSLGGNFPSVPSYKSRWDTKWKLFTQLLKGTAEHIKANNEPFAE